MTYLKARATNVLRLYHPKRERFWTKGGSARYFWDRESLARALHYVIDPMELWNSELL